MREIEAEMSAIQAAAESNKKGKGKSNKGGSSESSGIAPMTDTAGSGSNSDSSNNKSESGDGNSGDTNLAGIASSLSGAAGAGLGLTSSGNDDNNSDATDNSANQESKSGSSGSAKKSVYSGVKSDNLQIIEGIGPKMEIVLKENGVNTHAELASKSPDELQAILGKYGDKYKIIDPTTWAQQAGYAASGDYDGMIDLQKKLDTGKDNASGLTDSKLEKYLIKTGALKAFKQDDLKAIEGIGPATEKLLHSNGIMTWRDLANTEASAVKAILNAAGSRFALGDPTTWPKQAELAADGEFDKLREYQDFLDGGRA